MRECAFNAGLIQHKNSPHLKFTTERKYKLSNN